MPLPRKDSPSSTRSERSAREPGFAQTARGLGPVGKMFSAWLAIANAVKFSVCSGVLRVLGLARANSSGVAPSKVFCKQRPFLGSDWQSGLGLAGIFLTEGGSGMRWSPLPYRSAMRRTSGLLLVEGHSGSLRVHAYFAAPVRGRSHTSISGHTFTLGVGLK